MKNVTLLSICLASLVSFTGCGSFDSGASSDLHRSSSSSQERKDSSSFLEGRRDASSFREGSRELSAPPEGRNDLSPTGLVRKYVKDAVARKALCNDGTPAVYYIRSGFEGGANRWVIHLKGGGSCSDPSSCQQRWEQEPTRMSSSSYEAKKFVGGVMNPNRFENKDFYNWNHVYVMYCSSDNYVGDRIAKDSNGVVVNLNRKDTGKSFPLRFRGKRIIRSIVEDLLESGLSRATHVLFSGSSAGGKGARMNLDQVAETIKKRSPSVYIRGVADSGMMPSINASHKLEMIEKAKRSTMFWNAIYDPYCLSKVSEAYQCYLSAAIKYVRTPMFVFMDQNDSNFLRKLGPKTGREVKDAMALSVRRLFAQLDAGFSSREFLHVALTNNQKFFQMRVPDPRSGWSYAEVLGHWFFGRSGPVKVVQPEE